MVWALVTGGGRRLGKAISLSLAKELSLSIALTFRKSFEDAKRTLDEINSLSCKGVLIRADFSSISGVDDVLKFIEREDVRVIINNASDFSDTEIKNLENEKILSSLNLHFVVPFLLTKKVWEKVRRKRKGAVVVNITDAVLFRPDKVAYSTGKLLLNFSTKFSARLFAPYVRVNAVAPGPVLPPVGGGKVERVIKKTLLKKRVSPQAVADTVVFLVKNEYITGQVIYVDSGLHIVGMWGID